MSIQENEIIFASELEANSRVDKLLASRFPELSRAYFQHLIEQELVLLNGKKVKKREKPQSGDEIEIHFALTPELDILPEPIPLDILYEDEYLLVVNKPAGMVVHPAPGNWSKTFVNALLHYCSELSDCGDPKRPGIVHRLDKETSGLLIAAKTSLAHRKLVASFAERAIHKEYLAICIGHFEEGLIDQPIGRHPIHRQQMTILSSGKQARTYFYPLAKLDNFSIVQCILETGRTHQIRVHLKHIGKPILGDSIYGNETLNNKLGADRQFLHAHRLSFRHPITSQLLNIEAPLPQDMNDFIKKFISTDFISSTGWKPNHLWLGGNPVPLL
jgi:23S rRNA pseudouridine1911/1915/1917 synthase